MITNAFEVIISLTLPVMNIVVLCMIFYFTNKRIDSLNDKVSIGDKTCMNLEMKIKVLQERVVRLSIPSFEKDLDSQKGD